MPSLIEKVAKPVPRGSGNHLILIFNLHIFFFLLWAKQNVKFHTETNNKKGVPFAIHDAEFPLDLQGISQKKGNDSTTLKAMMELNFFDLLSDREKWELWEQGRGDLVIWGRTLFDSLANTTLLYVHIRFYKNTLYFFPLRY